MKNEAKLCTYIAKNCDEVFYLFFAEHKSVFKFFKYYNNNIIQKLPIDSMDNNNTLPAAVKLFEICQNVALGTDFL